MAIKKYDEIFHMDHTIEKASQKEKTLEKRIEYIQKMRERKLKPLFVEFFAWLKEIEPRNAGKYSISRAIAYTLNHQEELMKCIENGYIALSNNICLSTRKYYPQLLVNT